MEYAKRGPVSKAGADDVVGYAEYHARGGLHQLFQMEDSCCRNRDVLAWNPGL